MEFEWGWKSRNFRAIFRWIESCSYQSLLNLTNEFRKVYQRSAYDYFFWSAQSVKVNKSDTILVSEPLLWVLLCYLSPVSDRHLSHGSDTLDLEIDPEWNSFYRELIQILANIRSHLRGILTKNSRRNSYYFQNCWLKTIAISRNSSVKEIGLNVRCVRSARAWRVSLVLERKNEV